MDDVNKKLCSLNEISKAQLAKILRSVSGSKDLTLEPTIIKPLERICGVSWLKSNGIEKIYKLEPTAPKLPNIQFYMIFSNMKTFKSVLDLIQSQLDLENPKQNNYHIICVPKALYIYENMLEELGLFHAVIKLYSFQWFPINLDNNLLSIEIPHMYRSLYVQQDYSLLPIYAKSLWHIFHVFGKPKFTLALGQYANIIINQLDEYEENFNDVKSEFSGLVVLDRSIDYCSALLTPGTYSALLSEIYSVQCGICDSVENKLDKYDEKFNPILQKSPVQFALDSNKDVVYRDIKNKYFTEVTMWLSKLTKELRSEGESSRDMALDQIKRYVKTQLQAAQVKKKHITNHLIAAETIINCFGQKFEKQIEIERNLMQNRNKSNNFSYLEEILTTENDKYSSLMLMCLIVITQKLSDGELKSFLNKFFLEFGYEYGFVYRNLINANFIQELTPVSIANLSSKLIKMPLITSTNFHSNANKLKQIPPDPDKIDLKTPKCCSYVFGGCYIPLLAQIASLILNATPLTEVRAKLANFGALDLRGELNYPLQSKTLLMYVVGGITYSEVAACNLLENLIGAKIVLMSDKFISGRDIAKAMLMV